MPTASRRNRRNLGALGALAAACASSGLVATRRARRGTPARPAHTPAGYAPLSDWTAPPVTSPAVARPRPVDPRAPATPPRPRPAGPHQAIAAPPPPPPPPLAAPEPIYPAARFPSEPTNAPPPPPPPPPEPEPTAEPPLPAPVIPAAATLGPHTPEAARVRRAARRANDRHRRAARPRDHGPATAQAAGSLARLTARPGASRLLATLAVLVCAATAWATVPSGASSSTQTSGAYPANATAFARDRIPSTYMHLYARAAHTYGLPWQLLAAVGQVESNHGLAPLPGVRTGTNFAGAAGPAQFLPSTFARYGVDGNADGRIDLYEPADAIPSMAAYLKASGAPTDSVAALHAYNHSWTYVANVLRLSRRLARG